EKDVTVKNNNSNAPNDSKTATVNPWAASSETTISDFSSPIVPSTSASSTPASLTPAVTTNSVASPELPFSLESSAVQNEKENVVQNSLALSPTTTTTTATTPEPLSPELSLTAAEQSVTPNLTPLAIANTETPAATVAGVTLPAADVSVTAKTAQLTPLKIQSATTDAPSSPPSSNFSDTKISGNQALTIPKSEGEVQTLPQLSAFSQPSSEPSLNIPEQSHTNSEVSGEFSKAPTPPEMTSPISSPIIEPVIPVVTTKKEETVPAIPKSGTVQTFADVTDSALTSLSPSEPSPAIPTDSVTFTQPAAPLTASSPAPVTQTPFVPPTLPQSTLPQSTAPQSTVSAPFASNTETVAKIEEPVLKIPKDSQHSDVTVSAMPIPAAAILPQHRELAKVEPPLGSQLQNQVREIRNQESSETRLRFGSDAHAPTGAVRYHPKSTVQNINDLHSSQAMPIDASDPNSNPLVTLLPNGNGNPTPETFNSLPPLEKAPKFETATPNPAYRRSLNLETPVSVQPENLSSMPNTANTPNNATINNSERRAKLFRRIDDEIKRSPESAEQYTVQKNDTYMTISDRFFGTIRLFRALAEYNRQKYGTDYKLPEGTIVEIPPVDYLKTNYAEMFTRSRQRPEKNITVSGSGVRYIVQEEDTVFRIATNQLRDSSRWQEIIEMNSDKLRSPRDLQPGMEIILPVTTATQTTYGRR
ncbi:MAG: LysM peptidoglycan-binding domain-containing protein, partial [Planctomycetaceae bacterium]|nr:LysM peptidoglycan-binding domain-containing protein [Planctomycetaceae bacterium]